MIYYIWYIHIYYYLFFYELHPHNKCIYNVLFIFFSTDGKADGQTTNQSASGARNNST